jgi:hypothetical protein
MFNDLNKSKAETLFPLNIKVCFTIIAVTKFKTTLGILQKRIIILVQCVNMRTDF